MNSPPDQGLFRVYSGAGGETGASEQRGPGIAATIGEWGRRCRPHSIDVIEQEQGIGEIDPEITVGISSLHALWNRALVEQIGETEDRISDVDVAVAIAVTAQVVSIEYREAIQYGRVGLPADDDLRRGHRATTVTTGGDVAETEFAVDRCGSGQVIADLKHLRIETDGDRFAAAKVAEHHAVDDPPVCIDVGQYQSRSHSAIECLQGGTAQNGIRGQQVRIVTDIDVESLHVTTGIVDGHIDPQLIRRSVEGGGQSEGEVTATLGNDRSGEPDGNEDNSNFHRRTDQLRLLHCGHQRPGHFVQFCPLTLIVASRKFQRQLP